MNYLTNWRAKKENHIYVENKYKNGALTQSAYKRKQLIVPIKK